MVRVTSYYITKGSEKHTLAYKSRDWIPLIYVFKRLEAVVSAGPTAGRKYDWKGIKEAGYAALGWEAATGKPLESSLEELGLSDLVKKYI